jgi:hypothetical protein
MESKQMIWIGLFVGSTIGSFLPLIWGGSELSMSGVLLGAVGGILGIWAGLKISQQ